MKLHIVLSTPRQIVLESSTHVLVLQADLLSTPRLQQQGLAIEGVTFDFMRVEDYRGPGRALEGDCYGCLGIVKLEGDIFVVVIDDQELHRSPATFLAESDNYLGTETVVRVRTAHFHCLTSAAFDSDLRAGNPTHPAHHLRNIMDDRSFYYAMDHDLTTRLAVFAAQRARTTPPSFELPLMELSDQHATRAAASNIDVSPDYVYNLHLLSPILAFRQRLGKMEMRSGDMGLTAAFDAGGFAIPVIHGYVGSTEVQLGSEKAVLTVVSRLNWRRTGTRYLYRGADLNGWVAQHAETETILRTRDKLFSFALVRGSVPLIWTEVPGKKHITLDIHPSGSYEAFMKHFFSLFDAFSLIHCINLMESTLHGNFMMEGQLGANYAEMVTKARQEEEEIGDRLTYEEFDFSRDERIAGLAAVPDMLDQKVAGLIKRFGATELDFSVAQGSPTTVNQQKGTFRVNCRDCCDRTGATQSLLARFALEQYLRKNGALRALEGSEVGNALRVLFAENGDALSVIYVGTSAMFSNFTRTGKRTVKDIVANGVKFEQRKEQWRLHDPHKQEGIDQMVGQGIFKDSAVSMGLSEDFIARYPAALRKPQRPVS